MRAAPWPPYDTVYPTLVKNRERLKREDDFNLLFGGQSHQNNDGHREGPTTGLPVLKVEPIGPAAADFISHKAKVAAEED